MSNNNKKYQKWTPEWEKEVTNLVGGEKSEKELKKGEIKPDGTLVTAESEKIKTNDFELLLGQIKYQKELIKTKKDELAKKHGYADEAKQILKEIKELEPKVKEWDKFASWFESAYQKFLNGGTGGYGTSNVGWKTILNTYLQSKYKKVANTSPSETNNTTATEDYGSNLYEFSTRTETDNNQISYWKLTENEVIKLITRTVKELGAIDYDKFVTHTNSNTHPLSTSASEIDKAEFTASKLQGYLKVIQDRAKNLVDNKIKSDNHPDKGKPANGHRIEYSFGQDFTKSGTNTPQDSANFTETELIGLFRLMRACQDSTWTGQASFQTATAGVKNDTLIVLPAKSNPMNKSDFTNFTPEDLGIPVDSSGKSNFYATDYGTKISDEEEDKVEYSWDTKKELKIESGIEGWAKLIEGISRKGHSDYTNRQKLISSFTNDPVRQLFADIRTYVHKDNSLKTDKDGSGTSTPDYACFGSGTNRWTYQEFPDFATSEESRLNEYETEKASLLEGVKTGRESLKAAEKALAEAKKELVKKKKEVESKITEKITELRKKLANDWKITATEYQGFEKTTTADNRIELTEIITLETLLEKIRYLENFNENTPSSVNNEELARQALVDLQAEIFTKRDETNKIYLVRYFRDGEGRTEIEKIESFEKSFGSQAKWVVHTLQEVVTGFDNLENKIKLPNYYLEMKKAIKDYLAKQSYNEKPTDWQNDSALGTDFTDEIVGKWKTTNKFKSIAEVRKLLQAVRETDKTDFREDFLKWLKDKKIVEGDDTTEKGIENWKILVKKDPQAVITAIEYYKYDKLADALKAEKKKQLVWTLEKKDDAGKYLEDADLTEEEIKTILYELAEGKKTLASEKKADETNGDDTGNPTDKMSIAKEWFGFGSVGKSLLAYTGIIAVAVGIVGMIFWENVKTWWHGKPEEEVNETEVSEESEDE